METDKNLEPLVSFCISTFKRGPILQSTLESIKRQTYGNYEVIVSDNDPEGTGQSFVESLRDERFKYYNNGSNLGMKPSFNKSLERSKGEYIVMMADDDPVYPHMLETLVNLRNKFPGYGMYMGGCDWFCFDKDVAGLYNLRVGTNSCISNNHDLNFVREYSTAEFIKSLFTFEIFSHFLWSSCIVKRGVLTRMGGVPDYGTPFLGDYAYMSIASTEKGCVVINNSLGCQTLHRENFGRNQNDQLTVLARNFPAYLENKLSYLSNWQEIQKIIRKFFGVWITGHMAFLYHYYRKNNLPDNNLSQVEKEIFKIESVRGYKMKYVLKKSMPGLHDFAVKAKKALLRGKRIS